MNLSEEFVFTSNEVFCLSYFCRNCDKFLFNSGDTLFRTRLFNRVLIFTRKSTVADLIQIFGTNAVRCKSCYHGLGGMVYQNWASGNHLVRFARHTLRQRMTLLWKCND